MGKMGQNFHICLRSGLPPPPYGQPDCKISVCFTTRIIWFEENLIKLQFIGGCSKNLLIVHLIPVWCSDSSPQNRQKIGERT